MVAQTLFRYVTCNSEILSGEPIITDTRTSILGIVGGIHWIDYILISGVFKQLFVLYPGYRSKTRG
jgi:hypothetical protein